MKQLDLIRQVLEAAAELRGVPVSSVRVGVERTGIELCVEGEKPTPISPRWSPDEGGIVEDIDVAPALAHHHRYHAKRRVEVRASEVDRARLALESAERALAEAEALRDGLASIVNEGVEIARAARIAKQG